MTDWTDEPPAERKVAILRIVVSSNEIRESTPEMDDEAVPRGRVMFDALEQFDMPPPVAEETIDELLSGGELYEVGENGLEAR